METQALAKKTATPSLFNEFFKPWNEWFANDSFFNTPMKIPAVNITERDGEYEVALAAPGLSKDDFNIDVDGNMLTISSEKEENKEEKDKKFTRKEYSYASFSRSFTLPDAVIIDKIDANYSNGVLKILLPLKKDESKKANKKISIK